MRRFLFVPNKYPVRIILFSGGVESTALATMSDKNDILLLSEFPFKSYHMGYDLDKAKTIANLLDRELIVFKCELPIIPKNWMHQLNWLVFVAHLLTQSRNNVSDIWYGRNSYDITYSEQTLRELQDVNSNWKNWKALNAWKELQPTIPFHSPLENLTKKEQWSMIPDNIKPWVNSCLFMTNCGQCTKCREFKNLVLAS